MIRNVGESDQVLRILMGALLLTLAATEQLETWGWITGFLTLGSGTFGFCALYRLLGLDTNKNNQTPLGH